MDNIKISAVILMSGTEKYLIDCIDSILNQTLKEFEIIAVNDGLDDNCLELLQRCGDNDKRIKIINRTGEGGKFTKKFGLDATNGDYLLFINSEDMLEKDAFEKLYENAVKNDSDIVVSGITFLDNIKNEIIQDGGVDQSVCFNPDTDFLNFTFTHKDIRPLMINRFIASWNKLYRTSFLRKYNNFLYNKQDLYEDSPFQLQLMLRAHKMSFSPHKSYINRIMEKSAEAPENADNSSHIEIVALVERVKQFLKQQKQVEDYTTEFLEYIYNDFAFLCGSQSDSLEASFYNKMKQEFGQILNVSQSMEEQEPFKLNLYQYILSSKNSLDTYLAERLESLMTELNDSQVIVSKHEHSIKKQEVALKAQKAILADKKQEIEEQNELIAEQGKIIYRRTAAIKKIKNSLSYKIAKSITKTVMIPNKMIKKFKKQCENIRKSFTKQRTLIESPKNAMP